MQPKTSIRAVILDAGGVVVFPNMVWLREQAASLGLQLSVAALLEGYYRTIHKVDLSAELPRIGAAFTSLDIRIWFFKEMLLSQSTPAERAEAVGRELAVRAQERFPRESDIYHWAPPGVRDRLLALRRAGFLLGAASNNDDALHAQMRSVGVHDLFGALMDSGREGVSKPDPELLWRAARVLGVHPDQCLFVGDVDRVDGAAARAAGMHFALLDPLDQPRPAGPRVISGLESIPWLFQRT